MLIAPDARAGIVVLINSDTAGANALGSQLLKIVLGLPEGQQKEISVDPGLYDAYVGTYKMDGFALTIGRENGHLFAEINGRNVQLFPKSIRDYFFKAFDSELSFVTDSNGRATDLILHEGGIDIDAVRVK